MQYIYKLIIYSMKPGHYLEIKRREKHTVTLRYDSKREDGKIYFEEAEFDSDQIGHYEQRLNFLAQRVINALEQENKSPAKEGE